MSPTQALEMVEGFGEFIPAHFAKQAINKAFEEGIIQQIKQEHIELKVSLTRSLIYHAINEVYNVSAAGLKGRSKLANVSDARKNAAYHLYSLIKDTRMTGRELGGRDHSTITYLVHGHKKLFSTSKIYREKAIRVSTLLKTISDVR